LRKKDFFTDSCL